MIFGVKSNSDLLSFSFFWLLFFLLSLYLFGGFNMLILNLLVLISLLLFIFAFACFIVLFSCYLMESSKEVNDDGETEA